MRRNLYDIKAFNFGQLSALVTHISDTHPGQLHIFSTFADQAIAQNFYDPSLMQERFGGLASLVTTLALHGQLTRGATMLCFFSTLAERI